MKRVFVLLTVAFFLVACGSKSVDIEGEKVTYDELKEKIKEKEEELDEITIDLNKNKNHYEELQEIEEEHQELLDGSLYYREEITELDEEIEEKEIELNKINGDLVKVKDDPIKINPGTYYFGEDLEEGRYKVTYQDGEHGNIYFHGDEDFAQTFGNDETKEYTFNANEGEDIKTDIQALLYPIE